MKDIAAFAGRVLIAILFLFESYNGMLDWNETKNALTEIGISWQPDFWIFATIFLLILASTLLIVGYRSRLGAIILLLYFVPATFITYNFWNQGDDLLTRRENLVDFIRNLAIIGGLLILWAHGSGKYSIKRLFATIKIPSMKDV
ncbi:MAG: DoxX family membrane protein [Bacteroidota bacterium]